MAFDAETSATSLVLDNNGKGDRIYIFLLRKSSIKRLFTTAHKFYIKSVQNSTLSFRKDVTSLHVNGTRLEI